MKCRRNKNIKCDFILFYFISEFGMVGGGEHWIWN